MGWLTEYYSKIIKIPWIMRRQMRRRATKISRILRHMAYFIYQKITDEVLKRHEVTKAEKDQIRISKDAKKVETAINELAFDEQIEEALTLKEIKEIEKKILLHEEKHGSTGFEAEFGKKIIQIIDEAHGEDREIYFTFVEPIIKVAENTADHRTLVAVMKGMGPNQINRIATLALRLEIRLASKELVRVRHDKSKIEDALSQWDEEQGNKRTQERQIEILFAEVEIDIKTALQNDILIAKRNFLLALLTLKFIDDNNKDAVDFITNTLMPTTPERLRIAELEEVKKKMAEHMHTLAQGLRRIDAAESYARQLAGVIEKMAYKGARRA